MVERVRRYVEKWNMICPGDEVTLGVSGGADSVCLLLLMRTLAKQMGFTLRVVHVEHGIRGEESQRDAEFVEALCRTHGLPFSLCRVDVPAYAQKNRLGIEEAARILRYEALTKAAKGPIALAHHRDDNVETILFQMVRGTGLDGLCGMQPVRFDESGNKFIRPLLEQSRTSIEQYLKENGQTYCTDSTNVDLSYSRNRIRQAVIPELNQVNEKAALHIHQMAEQMLCLRSYLEEETKRAYACVAKSDDSEGGSISLCVEMLKNLPDALTGRVVLQALWEVAHCKKDFSLAHVEAVLSLLEKQSGRRVYLPYGILAYRQYESICLTGDYSETRHEVYEVSEEILREICAGKEEFELFLEGEEESLILSCFRYFGDSAEISTNRYTKWFDSDKIKSGFCVRNRRSGDYFVMDKEGRHKKLSDYLIDEKIPAPKRDAYRLICQDSNVFWMIGGRMGYGAAVTEETRLVLQIEYKGGKDNGLP